jgi:predicted ArsR family transcriptional regulator
MPDVITLRQLEVLGEAAESPGTAREIADRLGISTGAVWAAIRGLTAKGLVSASGGQPRKWGASPAGLREFGDGRFTYRRGQAR